MYFHNIACYKIIPFNNLHLFNSSFKGKNIAFKFCMSQKMSIFKYHSKYSD